MTFPSIPRRLAALAAMSALAVALGTSPVVASPVGHMSLPYDFIDPSTSLPAFPPIVCSHHTYSLTAGDFIYVTRDPSSAAHVTVNHAWANDEAGASYHVVGAETYNDPGGRFTSKLMFVRPGGGIADSVNVVYRMSPNGHEFGFDQGTCAF